MLNQNLELFKVFLTVAEAKTLKDAALALNVTPSAVTQSLQKFEEQMGLQLFLREHKKVILTPQGQVLKEKIQPLMRQLEIKLQDFLSDAHLSVPHGLITIGAPSELGSSSLVQCFGQFQKKYPKVKAKLRFAHPLRLQELVATGEVDFCLMADGEHKKFMNPNLLAQKIFDEEFIVICSKKFYQQHKFKTTYEELIKLPHLDYVSDGSAVNTWYQFHFKKKASKLNIVMTGENALSMIEGIKQELGIAMIPVQRLKQDLKSGDFHIVKPTDKKLLNPILLLQHQTKVPTLAEKRFIEFIQQQVRIFE